MSVAPLNGPVRFARKGAYSLAPFDNLMAPLVARWARSPQELFWLAPSTPPPLTAVKVVNWPGATGGPRLFRRDEYLEPIGYCELNPMPAQPGHYWIGHCVLRPDHRGCGLGRLMIELVLAEAFEQRGAFRVSLMVFPDNLAAYHCYLASGLREAGEQYKHFATTGKRYRMIQMSISRERFSAGRRAGQLPGAGPAPRGA